MKSNKKTQKKWAVIALVLCLLLSAVGCGSSEDNGSADVSKSTVDIIKEKGKIVVGTSADYPPYEFHFMDENGKDTIVGSDITLAKAIAEELGVELELMDMSFDGLLMNLSEGKYDMVIAGLTPDPARKVLFSEEYNQGEQVVLIQTKDKALYKKQSDLDGKKIAAGKGTVQADIAADLAENVTPILLVSGPDQIQALKEGSVDAVLTGKEIALVYAAANPDVMIADIKIPYEFNGTAIGFQEGNQALCDAVNEILDKLQKEGALDKMLEEAAALAASEEKKATSSN